MNKKLGQEPAFPPSKEIQELNPDNEGYNIGISKRFYAACTAMQGMLTNIEFLKKNGNVAIKNGEDPDKYLIRTAYSLADELLKQESND